MRSVASAVENGQIQGGGVFTSQCTRELEAVFGTQVLVTHSATAALEMSARLCNLKPGDEVIVPDYTFPSSASAIALTGAKPVFVDVSRDSLNIDARAAEDAISQKTKAVMVVHYGGVSADMESLLSLASANGLDIIEDAAQCFGVLHEGAHLGSLGRFGAISFHGTKNVQSGEGGALLVRDESDFEKAEIIHEKGTNRSQFFRGEVDKYTWQLLGSSFLPSELTSAYLIPQISDYQEKTRERVQLWKFYKEELRFWAAEQNAYVVSEEMGHLGNGHIFAIVFSKVESATRFRAWMAANGIQVVSHYQPLHLSPAGSKYGRSQGGFPHSIAAGEGLVRFPMHPAAQLQKEFIVKVAKEFSLDERT